MTGCPEAHAKLGLVSVVVDVPQAEFPLPLKTLKSHYATASKARVAAKVLGRNTLEELCKECQELIDFAAHEKYKKRLKCNYTEHDILRTLGAHMASLRASTIQLGDAMSQQIELVENAVQAALEGDIAMLKYFGLGSMKFMITPLKKVPSLTQLRATYGANYTIAAAASKIRETFLKQIACNTLLYLRWFAREAFPNEALEVTLDSCDVCETIDVELRQVRGFLTESEVPLLEWRKKRHRRLADELEKDMEAEDSDPPTSLTPTASITRQNTNILSQIRQKGGGTVDRDPATRQNANRPHQSEKRSRQKAGAPV